MRKIDERILIEISQMAGYRHVGDLWFTNPYYKGGKPKKHMSWEKRHGRWVFYDFFIGNGGSLIKFLREFVGREDLLLDEPTPPTQETKTLSINMEIEREKLACNAAKHLYENCDLSKHEYLAQKGLNEYGHVLKRDISVPLIHKGEKKIYNYQKGTLFTFAVDIYTGEIAGYQTIVFTPEGWKKISQPRSWRTPIFGVIGVSIDHLFDLGKVAITEGYATGLSVYRRTGTPVLITYGISRVRGAVYHINQIDCLTKILFVADDDPTSLATGLIVANETHNVVCVKPNWEILPKGRKRGDKDFNDLDKRLHEQNVIGKEYLKPFLIETVEEKRSLIQKIKDGIIRLLL